MAISYTAPKSGEYKIRLASFVAPGSDGSADGLFALAKGGRVIWPAGGDGAYDKDENYIRITKDTTLMEMQEIFKDVTVYLEKGEVLQFTARKLDGWSRFSFVPVVIQPEYDLSG